MKNGSDLFNKVTTFIFDVDGVLTDGSVIMLDSGEPVRVMNIKDGYALQFAVRKGYRIAIISGGKSESVKRRFNGLGIDHVYLGVSDKIEVFEEFIKTYNIDKDTVLYMGDDMPDYEIMQEAGVPVCPGDAAEEIKEISKYISDKKGGKGCVRDVIERTLKAQDKWFDIEGFKW